MSSDPTPQAPSGEPDGGGDGKPPAGRYARRVFFTLLAASLLFTPASYPEGSYFSLYDILYEYATAPAGHYRAVNILSLSFGQIASWMGTQIPTLLLWWFLGGNKTEPDRGGYIILSAVVVAITALLIGSASNN